MSKLNASTLIPIDDVAHHGDTAIHHYMWSYAPSNRLLAYGTIGALVNAYSAAAYYGDGEDYSPVGVWALTVQGPVPVKMTFTPDETGVTIMTTWRLRVPGQRRATVIKEQGWYERPDN